MKTRPLLIAEDEENDVFFLKRAMQRAGIVSPLYVVESGQEAIEFLSGAGRFADRIQFPIPYLLLLDLKLPCVTGTEVLKWIRQESSVRCLPVVVLTSSTLSSDVSEAYSAGANAYAVKPADPEKLVELMRDFSNWWLKDNVPPPSP